MNNLNLKFNKDHNFSMNPIKKIFQNRLPKTKHFVESIFIQIFFRLFFMTFNFEDKNGF